MRRRGATRPVSTACLVTVSRWIPHSVMVPAVGWSGSIWAGVGCWPAARARASTGLVPYLPVDQRGPVFAQALAAASLAERDGGVDVLPAVLSIEEGRDLLAAAVVSSLLRVRRWLP